MSVAEANALDAGLDSRVGFGAIVLGVALFVLCTDKKLDFFCKSKASQLCESYVSQQADSLLNQFTTYLLPSLYIFSLHGSMTTADVDLVIPVFELYHIGPS